MAIEYKFLDVDDDELIEVSELPVEDGIAVAVRTTGYEIGEDEVLQLAIVDFSGNELFSQTVKPQNAEEWNDNAASGGIAPADVGDAPELYQFEDKISEIFANASIVVGEHIEFVHEAIESSWVSLPEYRKFDLSERFCASHSAVDYPNHPATVATLEGISRYYDLSCDESDAVGIAQAVAANYLKLVEEHAAERVAKGPEHWAEHERKLQEAAQADARVQEAQRQSEIKATRINAILWLCGAVIFINVAVQAYINGIDSGIVVALAIAAAYLVIRWGMSLYAIWKLHKQK